jgi:ankyrin repeat protein
MLLQHRKSTTGNSDSLLVAAVQAESVEILRMLLHSGIRDHNCSALIKTLERAQNTRARGCAQMIQLLVDKAASGGVTSVEQQAIAAAEVGAAGALDKLLCTAKEKALPLPPHLFHQLLRTAVSSRNRSQHRSRAPQQGSSSLQCVKVLVEHGADINAQQGAPLLAAVLHDNTPVLQFLLSQGVDVNAGGGQPCMQPLS